MTDQIDMNDQQDENQILSQNLDRSRIESISKALISLDKDSISASQRIQNLQVHVDRLKADTKKVMGRIEQNVDLFRVMLSDKLKVIINMLSDKQLHIETTLEECYNVISDLVEIFLSIGYESENNITNLSFKVDSLDNEIRKMAKIAPLLEVDQNYNEPYWFIDDDYQLTIRENESMGSILPKFKSGDAFERKQFITFMMQVFQHYKVPESAWVGLVTNQLVESALNWWYMYENKPPMNWSKFTELFMEAHFDNSETNDKFNNSKIYNATNISKFQDTDIGSKNTVSNSKTELFKTESNTNRCLITNKSFEDHITKSEHDIEQAYNAFSSLLDDIASSYKNKD